MADWRLTIRPVEGKPMSTITNKTEQAQTLIHQFLARSEVSCVTCSFQSEDIALVHMIIREEPGMPILFLDTGYHFPETLAYRDEMAERFGLKLVNLAPKMTVPEQESKFGILYQSSPDRCCAFRKVEPLFAALDSYRVWFTGLRREQSSARAGLEEVDDFRLPSGKMLTKVSPLASWTNREVWAYLKEKRIPSLPLYEQGYTSIGCRPCTQPPTDPDNPRSGRWGGRKLECGIHIQP
jgi:phosphoadenosine phosphosulfate reductase